MAIVQMNGNNLQIITGNRDCGGYGGYGGEGGRGGNGGEGGDGSNK